ncbi:MAG: hypothetical protein DMF71_11170 [Acidobacteria bacterium]|nr:MAG: hypothetical protein DMF71_11170 [Acidobacteriota bacterium]
MRKTLLLLLSVVAVCMCAAPAFAQAGNAPVSNNNHGLVFGGALGQSRIGAAACEGAARNPGAAGRIQTMMILGLALIESLVLFALVIIFAKVKYPV